MCEEALQIAGKREAKVKGEKERYNDSAGAAQRSFPTPEVRGGGREELPHVQGAAAARAREGSEELLHVQGQERP